MSMQTWSNAVVIGASSGIGAALARQLAARGAKVTLVARREERLLELSAQIDAVHGEGTAGHIVHDVENGSEVEGLWKQIVDARGEPDVVVYASGALELVEDHEYTFEKDRRMLAVNLVGAVAWLNCAALAMEAARGGTIIGISSIAADRGRRGAPVYGASKAGFTTYLEALRNRLSQYGVNVMTARPGFVDTAMTKGMDGLFWLVSADRAAEIILGHAAKGGSRDRYVPARWGLVGFVVRWIPSFLFRRLSI